MGSPGGHGDERTERRRRRDPAAVLEVVGLLRHGAHGGGRRRRCVAQRLEGPRSKGHRGHQHGRQRHPAGRRHRPHAQVAPDPALDDRPDGIYDPERQHEQAEHPAPCRQGGPQLDDGVEAREHADVAGAHQHQGGGRPPQRGGQRVGHQQDRQGEQGRHHLAPAAVAVGQPGQGQGAEDGAHPLGGHQDTGAERLVGDRAQVKGLDGHGRDEGNERGGQQGHHADQDDGRPAPRFRGGQAGALDDPAHEVRALGDRRRRRDPHQQQGHDDGGERDGIAAEGECVVAVADDDGPGGQGRADDPAQVELGRRQRDGGQQILAPVDEVRQHRLVGGEPDGPADPPRKASTTAVAGVARPVAASRVSTAAMSISAAVVTSSQRRRSRRSASAPPTGESRPTGRKAAAATRPVHSGLWVVSVTNIPRATACIHDPMFDTSAADHSRAKLRDPSGRSDRGSTNRGYRPGRPAAAPVPDQPGRRTAGARTTACTGGTRRRTRAPTACSRPGRTRCTGQGRRGRRAAGHHLTDLRAGHPELEGRGGRRVWAGCR